METISLLSKKLLASERTLICEYLKDIALNGGDSQRF
jgi:hypothetical protein